MSAPAIALPAAERSGPREMAGWLRSHQLPLISLLSVALLFAAWEWAANTNLLSPRFSSSPSRVFVVGVQLLADGTIFRHLQVSAVELAWGFAFAVLVAFPLGAAIAWFDSLEGAVDPFLSFFYSVPRVALVPLIVLWFGIGLNAKVFLIFISALFPMLLTTIAGFKNLNFDFVRCARSFGASEFQIFRTIAMPSSVPFLITSLRLGLGRALIGVVVAEMYAASAGIGFFITHSGALIQTDRVFVGIVVVAIAGIMLMGIVDLLEARVRVWFPDESH